MGRRPDGDTGQGTRLRQNYLRMRNQAETPKASRFTATPYSFAACKP